MQHGNEKIAPTILHIVFKGPIYPISSYIFLSSTAVVAAPAADAILLMWK